MEDCESGSPRFAFFQFLLRVLSVCDVSSRFSFFSSEKSERAKSAAIHTLAIINSLLTSSYRSYYYFISTIKIMHSEMDSIMEIGVVMTSTSSTSRGDSLYQHFLMESHQEEHIYTQPSNFEDIVSQNKLKLVCCTVTRGTVSLPEDHSKPAVSLLSLTLSV